MDNKDFFDSLEDCKKNKCVNCGREVKDIEKGCKYCDGLKEYYTNDYKDKLEIIKKEKNTISSVLIVIAWIILILGFIMGFIISVDEYDELSFPIMIEVWGICGISFLFIYSIGEIIQILHDIRKKIYSKK